jgi:hypothetical protein
MRLVGATPFSDAAAMGTDSTGTVTDVMGTLADASGTSLLHPEALPMHQKSSQVHWETFP